MTLLFLLRSYCGNCLTTTASPWHARTRQTLTLIRSTLIEEPKPSFCHLCKLKILFFFFGIAVSIFIFSLPPPRPFSHSHFKFNFRWKRFKSWFKIHLEDREIFKIWRDICLCVQYVHVFLCVLLWLTLLCQNGTNNFILSRHFIP